MPLHSVQDRGKFAHSFISGDREFMKNNKELPPACAHAQTPVKLLLSGHAATIGVSRGIKREQKRQMQWCRGTVFILSTTFGTDTVAARASV
jgi:hypothetical protein